MTAESVNDPKALAPPFEVRMRWGVRVPLRDGAGLSATLYLPEGRLVPNPCLVAFTPYVADRNHLRASFFAARGFPFLAVDVRGRGNSDGEFQPFAHQVEDGYDVIEWVAAQSFCDGKVALFSGSYEGYAQWAAAKAAPPHLVSLAPAVAAAPGIDLPMRNNIGYPYMVRWLTLIGGRAAQTTIFEDQAYWRQQFRKWYVSGAPFRELDSIVGHPLSTFQEWLTHPTLDSYWDARRLTPEEYSRLDLPILTITGCYDADQPGALHYYREHVRWASPNAIAKHYLVIGPWDHSVLQPKAEFGGLKLGPAALLDVLKLHLDWYHWTLRGGPRPEFLQKNVAYYVMGADRWRYAETLEAITAQRVLLYLDSPGRASHVLASGSLGQAPGQGPPDEYIYDPRDLSIAEVETNLELPSPPALLRPTFPADHLLDQSIVFANEGKTLIYHSAPFSQGTEISGFFKLTAWISIDQPDTDFLVTLYELTAQGSSLLLTSDVMRARYRESLRQERLIRTPDPLRYDFEHFTFVSKELSEGSRLRLVIGPANSIYYQKNYNSGGAVADESIRDARVVRVRLFHNTVYPSVLEVPIGQGSSLHPDQESAP